MLTTAVFTGDDLIRCYAPPNLREVMPGNRVMLRSGGPEMIVCDVPIAGQATCQWLQDGQLMSHVFALECLTCFGAK
jgi:uncharacterized protein YodC (DUF2158 family)